MEMRPSLIVFDLDYTLWPFWVDTHVDPPFSKKSDGKVYDSRNRHVKYYPDVPQILEKLKTDGYTLAVASRTTCRSEAMQLLQLFDWLKYFTHIEIYPGSKVSHFEKFQSLTGGLYNSMLFFDDEHRNIFDCSKLGVTCILVENGVNWRILEVGLAEFAKKNAGAVH